MGSRMSIRAHVGHGEVKEDREKQVINDSQTYWVVIRSLRLSDRPWSGDCGDVFPGRIRRDETCGRRRWIYGMIQT